jgi:hypothetical protein
LAGRFLTETGFGPVSALARENEALSRAIFLSGLDLFGPPVPAVPDQALGARCDLRLIRGTKIALFISPENQERGG